MNRRFLAHSLACIVATALFAAPITAEAADPTEEQIAALEKALSHSVMVGNFTVTGEGGDEGLSKERYELGDVKHLGKDQWLIPARIKYGDHDVTLPLTLPIRWAGDTPMICLDEMPIPGFGAFTARVMIYRDHYAGFWAGKDHGGHLFGVIERGEKNDDATKKAPTAN
jgi:hypothetical protein